MKPNTQIWLSCRSIGRPANDLTFQGTIREAAMEIAKWLLATYMGSRIEIRVGRRPEDLLDSKVKQDSNMLQDLEALIRETPQAEQEQPQ
jgi:hypothetical protein